jgi:hypothetical protein
MGRQKLADPTDELLMKIQEQVGGDDSKEVRLNAGEVRQMIALLEGQLVKLENRLLRGGNMAKQETIISIVDRAAIPADPEKYIGGKWNKGCVRILSDPDLEQVILSFDLPSGGIQEIVLDKAMLKAYVREIR